jgi:hypothetical protein
MKGLNSFENKVLSFMVALQNSYKDEESREDVPKLELTSDGITEDFTAILYAMYMFYKKVTQDEQDIIGFTHILNRLAVQHVMDIKNGGDEDGGE